MPEENLPEEKIYKTSDLALATVLSLSFPIEAIDKSNPQKAQFIFKRKEGLDKQVEKFWKQRVKIEPQRYFSQIKMVKSRLYNEN